MVGEEGLALVRGQCPRGAIRKPFLARDIALRDAGLVGVERTQVRGDLGIVRQVFDLWFGPALGLIAGPEECCTADQKGPIPWVW